MPLFVRRVFSAPPLFIEEVSAQPTEEFINCRFIDCQFRDSRSGNLVGIIQSKISKSKINKLLRRLRRHLLYKQRRS